MHFSTQPVTYKGKRICPQMVRYLLPLPLLCNPWGECSEEKISSFSCLGDFLVIVFILLLLEVHCELCAISSCAPWPWLTLFFARNDREAEHGRIQATSGAVSRKEINTYGALALFLAKKDIKENVRVGDKRVYLGPTYYKERVKEAKKLVNELRKTN